MRIMIKNQGQGLVEYALILVLIGVISITSLSFMGVKITDTYKKISQIETLENKAEESQGETIPELVETFSQLILDYYNENNSWPRSWGDYKYTDLGLDPEDWDEPKSGIYWNPHGSNFGMANRAGDDIEIYVTTLDGDRRHVYNGWSIWCDPITAKYYIHSISSENEVDIDTLEVIKLEN